MSEGWAAERPQVQQEPEGTCSRPWERWDPVQAPWKATAGKGCAYVGFGEKALRGRRAGWAGAQLLEHRLANSLRRAGVVTDRGCPGGLMLWLLEKVRGVQEAEGAPRPAVPGTWSLPGALLAGCPDSAPFIVFVDGLYVISLQT